MRQHGMQAWAVAMTVLLMSMGLRTVSYGAILDQNGEIKLGVLAYTGARIGTENTNETIYHLGGNPNALQTYRSRTFPVSRAGHLRQHRTFVQAEFDHDLRRLMREGFGPLALLNHLPFEVTRLKYHLEFRFEGEGVFDYGPREFSTDQQFQEVRDRSTFGNQGPNPNTGRCIQSLNSKGRCLNQIHDTRKRLLRLSRYRERLYQAYVETQVGDLWLRFGRQILAWGETDSFRLLDNINPIDPSFGGFLTSLDERRVPLDMLRANYYLGQVGPLSEVFIEAYGAIDNAVGYSPGVPVGSPWALPNDEPSTATHTFRFIRPRNFRNMRGGAQLKFIAPLPIIGETTFGLAHYYTYLDTPKVESRVRQAYDCSDPSAPKEGCDPLTFPLTIREGRLGEGFLAIGVAQPALVQITGINASFVIPSTISRGFGLSGEPVIRAELAYFRGEPRFTQAGLDPFVYTQKTKVTFDDQGNRHEVARSNGGNRQGDSWNFVLGIDTNQYIRSLNSVQSFFISTQFFYKHLNGAMPRRPITSGPPGCKAGTPGCDIIAMNGEVLPVTDHFQVPVGSVQLGALQQIFVHNPIDQYLQTLFISTSYMSGQVNPSLTLFYDWSGSFVAAPGVTFLRDPFRFRIEYDYLEASKLKGASGVSLLRDRDNVLFRFEYVI